MGHLGNFQPVSAPHRKFIFLSGKCCPHIFIHELASAHERNKHFPQTLENLPARRDPCLHSGSCSSPENSGAPDFPPNSCIYKQISTNRCYAVIFYSSLLLHSTPSHSILHCAMMMISPSAGIFPYT